MAKGSKFLFQHRFEPKPPRCSTSYELTFLCEFKQNEGPRWWWYGGGGGRGERQLDLKRKEGRAKEATAHNGTNSVIWYLKNDLRPTPIPKRPGLFYL